MKKRLSLLMVLMMVLSLVPMSAFATAGTVSGGQFSVQDKAEDQFKTVTVKLEQAAGTKLTTTAQAKLTLSKGEFTDATFAVSAKKGSSLVPVGTVTRLASFKDIAYLQLDANILTADNVGSDGTLSADVDLFVTFGVTLNDEGTGDVTLSVDEVESSNINVAKPLVIGVVTESVDADMKVTVSNSEKKIGMEKGTLSTFTVSDIDEADTDNDKVDTIVLELPDFMTWTNATQISLGATSYSAAQVASMIDSADANKLTISGISAADKTKDLIVKPDVTIKSKDAKMGDVVVDITAKAGSTELDTIDAVIGQVVDYDVTMTAVQSGKKEIPSLYGGETAKVKVTISGVKGSFTAGRTIYFTVDGAEVTTKSIVDIAKSADYSVDYDENKTPDGFAKDDEFSITLANNFSSDEVEFVIEISTDVTKDGAVTLTAESRDFEDLECDIADVTPAYTVEVAKVTDIKKGETLATADIVIKEAKTGMFESGDFIVLSLNDNYSGGLTLGSNYKIEATNELEVDDTLTTDDNSPRGDKNTLVLKVEENSRKEAGKITISNVLVNVSGSEVDGVKALETFLVVDNNVKKASEAVAVTTEDEEDADYAIDYVNVVKEYGAVATTTVFVIGSKTYTVNGVQMTANEAPYIAGKGYTMLPVRALAESLGLKADWNSNTKTATFSNDSKVASVTLGADTMYVNGTPIPLNAKAEIKNGSTFIELRSLASAFSVNLEWDAATKTVTVIG